MYFVSHNHKITANLLIECLNNLPTQQIMQIPDLYRNIIATCVVLGYVQILISSCERLVSKSIISSSLSRKIIHVGAASWLIFWPLYVDTDDAGWSWKLNIFIPLAKGTMLIIKGAIIRDREDKDVISMSRSGEPTELLCGPLQFTIVISCVGIYLFRTSEACLIMGALGVGDGIAPLVGMRYGRHTFGSPSGVKTLEGSAAVMFGTIVGYYVYAMAISASPLLPFLTVVLAGFVAAVTEAFSPSNVDNIAIALAMHIFYDNIH